MTKELTDEQIEDIAEPMQWYEGDIECISQVQFARAVIAADRELQDARWREELRAYALTVSNLREEIAGRAASPQPPAQTERPASSHRLARRPQCAHRPPVGQ